MDRILRTASRYGQEQNSQIGEEQPQFYNVYAEHLEFTISCQYVRQGSSS